MNSEQNSNKSETVLKREKMFMNEIKSFMIPHAGYSEKETI